MNSRASSNMSKMEQSPLTLTTSPSNRDMAEKRLPIVKLRTAVPKVMLCIGGDRLPNRGPPLMLDSFELIVLGLI